MAKGQNMTRSERNLQILNDKNASRAEKGHVINEMRRNDFLGKVPSNANIRNYHGREWAHNVGY
jgi:hypothetical protein